MENTATKNKSNVTKIATVNLEAFSYISKNGTYVASANDSKSFSTHVNNLTELLPSALDGQIKADTYCDKLGLAIASVLSKEITVVNEKTGKHGKASLPSTKNQKTICETVFGADVYNFDYSETFKTNRSKATNVAYLVLFQSAKKINEMVKSLNYKFYEDTKTFCSLNDGRYISYATVCKKLNLKIDRKANFDPIVSISKAKVSGNSKATPKDETINQEQTDKNFTNQLDVFITRTQKVSKCDNADAIFSALDILVKKAESMNVNIKSLLNDF